MRCKIRKAARQTRYVHKNACYASKVKALVCQSLMTALLRVWDSLSKAVTALLREMRCFRVEYLTVYLVIYSYQGINLTESCTTKE